MGTLQEFIGNMQTSGGFARPSRYEVWIYPPAGISKREINDQLTLQCVSIDMPGHDLETQSRQHGSEPERQMVQSHEYEGTIDATFLLSHDLRERSYFEKWQGLAVNKTTHKANYYDNYIGTMFISQLSSAPDIELPSYTMKVEEVYPVTVGNIEYSAESTDEVAEQTIKFQYRKWRNINIERQMGSGLEGLN
jgi:hypothetical protein